MNKAAHALIAGGAPHDALGARLPDPQPGRAMCSCGGISPTLTTDAGRRAWFTGHLARKQEES